MTRRSIPAIAALLGLAGCAMGPNYERPLVEPPATYRSAGPAAEAEKLAWKEVFQDQELQALLAEALKNNYDVRAAAARILEARSTYRVDRSRLFPSIDIASDLTETEISRGALNLPPTVPIKREQTVSRADLKLSYELDFWGRLRRLTEAGRAEFLSAEWAALQVRTDLIGDVSRAYFDLLEATRELEISKRTLETRKQSLRLTQARKDRGVATALEVRQAENLVYSAGVRIPTLEQVKAQQENLLSFLLGRNPGPITLGGELETFNPPVIPAGLPSQLVGRRADILAAEQTLVAANARIGAAKAALFPTFSLTGTLGLATRQFSEFLDGDSRERTLTGSLLAPVFNAGRLRSQVRISEARQEQMLIEYERAIRGAFREVADALAAVENTKQEYQQQARLVEALREARRLSNLRYEGGVDAYLQVLDSDRNLFAGELALAQIRRDEWAATVNLYKALGGGWDEPPAKAKQQQQQP
ncbi:MAG: efflux transporter outer membrane subunit [Acidobacteria bacterium]|nr:efflux transporter outer membrane subunit [Acidobacteriota bacterium]